MSSLSAVAAVKNKIAPHARFLGTTEVRAGGWGVAATMSGLPSDEIQRLNREEWKRLPDNPRAPHGPWMQVRSRTTDRRR
jgi:hypothetical protein